MASAKESRDRGTAIYELSTSAWRRRILLAEDDDPMRSLLAKGLRNDGFEVIEACSGAELVEQIGALVLHPPDGRKVDLIISDINMPWTSGLSVLASLRRYSWAPPVILITAFGDEETHLEAKRLGAVAVFDKPFDVNDLRTSALHFAGER